VRNGNNPINGESVVLRDGMISPNGVRDHVRDSLDTRDGGDTRDGDGPTVRDRVIVRDGGGTGDASGLSDTACDPIAIK
jgi:hypothetical protein